MLEKHSLKTLLRQPGSSLLTLLLSLLVAALLGTSLGLRALVEQTIRDCSDRYITLGIVDYLNGEDKTDPQTLAQYAAQLDALPLPASAMRFSPTQEALGWCPDYDGTVSAAWARNEAVLVVHATERQKNDGNTTVAVEEVLFSMRDVGKRIVALGETTLPPGGRYLVRGTWYAALPGTMATLLPDAEPLPLGDRQAAELPESDAFFARAAALELRRRGFTLRASDCFSAFAPIQRGQLSVVAGRQITDAEAAAGARVLMLSERLATAMGLSVGDTMHLCAAAAERCQLYESLDAAQAPMLDAEYTLVGILGNAPGWTETVLIPPCPELDMTQNHANEVLGQYRLRNDAAAEFEDWARQKLPGGLRLTVEDQGYHEIVAPLRTLRNLTRLITLACLLAGLGFLLLCAWLYVHRQRTSIRIMHQLGVGRLGILRYAVFGLLPLILPGTAGGMLLSRSLSRRFAAVLAKRLAEAQTLEYSYSATRHALGKAVALLQTDAPVSVFVWIGALCAIALLFLSAALALWAIPAARRGSVRRTGRTQGRTHSLRSAADYAWLSELRGGGRTLLVLLVPLLAALALGAMASSQEKTQQALDHLAERSTIRGMVTDLYGGGYDRLMTKLEDLRGLLTLQDVESAALTCTTEHFFYIGSYDPETGLDADAAMPGLAYNEYAFERLVAAHRAYPSLIYANRLDDAPAFLYAGEPVTAWLDGWESVLQQAHVNSTSSVIVPLPEQFDPEHWPAERDALLRAQLDRICRTSAHMPCVVSTAFLQAHGLALGDLFLVSYPLAESAIVVLPLRAVGSYVKLNGSDNIYLPLSLLLEGNTLADYDGQMKQLGSLRVNSAVFRFSCADLEGLRTRLAGLGFTEIGYRGGGRRPFLLEDWTYLNLRSNLEQRLWYMERIFFAAAVLLMLLSPLLGSLTALTRRRELRLMRGLGAARLSAFASVFLGQAGSCLLGTLAGVGLCHLLDWRSPTGSMEAAAFAALWLLGSAAVTACNIRKGGVVQWRSSN